MEYVDLILSAPAVKNSPAALHARLLSFLAGLIFVAHPIQTQAVTYIIQRTASLAAFFYLLSLCLYLKARLNDKAESLRGSDRDRGNPVLRMRLPRQTAPRNDIAILSVSTAKYYAGSILTAIAALFTKEISFTLPFMLLLCEVSFFRDGLFPK